MYSEAEKRKGGVLDVGGYEFLIYRLLRRALEAGNVYVRDSNEFRSFEDDLIRPERWKDKDAVLREIGAPVLLAPIEEDAGRLPYRTRRQVRARQQAQRERRQPEHQDRRHQ